MYTRMIHALGLFFLAGLFAGAGSAFADEASIKAGMKERLPKVLALKDAGTVGEGADGMLHARDGLGEDGVTLIAAENTERKAFYVIKAKQIGGAPADVAKVMAKGFLVRGKKGHWFRDAVGKWRQK